MSKIDKSWKQNEYRLDLDQDKMSLVLAAEGRLDRRRTTPIKSDA